MLWFGTANGVSRYDGKRFFNITKEDGLADNYIVTIHGTTDGKLWFGTEEGGISVYDGTTWMSLDKRDGLPANEIRAIYEGKEGELWFGTNNEISCYRRNSSPPSVRIVDVQTDRKYTDLTTIPPITAGNRVTIEYHAIDFKTHPEKRQYRCRIYESQILANAEVAKRSRSVAPQWRQTSGSPNVAEFAKIRGFGYTNTPYNPPTKATIFDWTPKKPGDYLFEVQAIDRDLNYSEPAHVFLTIVPPWYLNGWIAIPAVGAIFALLSSSIFFGWRYIDKRREAQRLQNHLFEQEKQARETLESRNAELERALKQARWGITTIRGLAHNLKNTTVWISRHCDFIRAGDISSDADEKIQSVQKISDQMVQNFRRLFDATGTPQFRSFNLATIMNVLSLQVVQGNPGWKTNIQIDRQYGNQIDIVADLEKLSLTLRDVIVNACEAMEEKGGTLTIKITANLKGVLIEIEDTGKGTDTISLNLCTHECGRFRKLKAKS